MNGLQIKTNSPIRTLINKKYTRNAYTCIIFKEDVHISIVGNPRPSYFCATIKTLKQHDEEKINTIILFSFNDFTHSALNSNVIINIFILH